MSRSQRSSKKKAPNIGDFFDMRQGITMVPKPSGDDKTPKPSGDDKTPKPFGDYENPEDFAQRAYATILNKPEYKQRDIDEACKNKIIRLLHMISITRNDKDIRLYEIIETLMDMEKASSIFIEGSSVIYMYDKFCLEKPDNELIRPGDIDLHVDYKGNWAEFITPPIKDKRDIEEKRKVDERLDAIVAREKEINKIKQQEKGNWQDINKKYQPVLNELAAEKAKLLDPSSSGSKISRMLALRGSDISLRKGKTIANVDISKTIGFDMVEKGGINWKSNPEVELTIVDVNSKEMYKAFDKEGFIVSGIPKLHFTKGPYAGELRVHFENVTSNYTGINFAGSDAELVEKGAKPDPCTSFIKAFELYLRYKDESSLEQLPDNPLMKFNRLPCLADLPETISNWDGKEIALSNCNKFLCGLLTLISTKHEEDTIKNMVNKVRILLVNTYRNSMVGASETQISLYILMCCCTCITAGFCEREDCGNKADDITGRILEILKDAFSLGPIQQVAFRRVIKQNVDGFVVRKGGYGRGKKRKRHTRKKRRKATKKMRNRKGKSKRNKGRKTKRR